MYNPPWRLFFALWSDCGAARGGLLAACIRFIGIEGGRGADREVGGPADGHLVRAQKHAWADAGVTDAVRELYAGSAKGCAPGGTGEEFRLAAADEIVWACAADYKVSQHGYPSWAEKVAREISGLIGGEVDVMVIHGFHFLIGPDPSEPGKFLRMSTTGFSANSSSSISMISR